METKMPNQMFKQLVKCFTIESQIASTWTFKDKTLQVLTTESRKYEI